MADELSQRMRAIDEQLAAVPLPPRLEQRIASTVRARRSRTSTRLIAAGALAAVVLAFVLGRNSAPVPAPTVAAVTPTATPAPVPTAPPTASVPPVVPPHAPPTALWDGQLLAPEDCHAVQDGQVVRIEQPCRVALTEPPLTMDLWRASQIARAEHGVRVLQGSVLFAVQPVPAGSPKVRVEVAGGSIEVLGTRFLVEQDDTNGHVDLLEGSIAFQRPEGAVAVVPGQRLTWTSDGPTKTRPARADAPQSNDNHALDATLEEVAALRRAGRYHDAIAILVRARRDVTDRRVAEILSYEEGTLRMRDDRPEEICAYWRGHNTRFESSRHAASIRAHMKSAGCGEP